ncbi:hypothetical protein K458DRAFT_426577 [Lentithecium fluviatile CBS 122367]|uniref:Protein kinase domain-containing protein n=1 Tax=Lentithecium fluviatile CBS 122367 TaxID=1168545 RepID=A0A6G1JM41_9PLEO|nr:hypothetical protein K458DRAFT_426577 [Lentithecium fluviatile CBS 122367]
MGSSYSRHDEEFGDLSLQGSAEALEPCSMEHEEDDEPLDSLNNLYSNVLSEFEKAVNDETGWAWSRLDNFQSAVRLHDLLLSLRHWKEEITFSKSSSKKTQSSYESHRDAEQDKGALILDKVELDQEFLSGVIRSYMDEILKDLRSLHMLQNHARYDEDLAEVVLKDLEASTKCLMLQTRPLREFSRLLQPLAQSYDGSFETAQATKSNEAFRDTYRTSPSQNQELVEVRETGLPLSLAIKPTSAVGDEDITLSPLDKESPAVLPLVKGIPTSIKDVPFYGAARVKPEEDLPRGWVTDDSGFTPYTSFAPDDMTEGADYKTVNETLRRCAVYRANARQGMFWPEKLLRRILTRDRISDALQRLNGEPVTDIILPTTERSPNEYLKIFAVLALMEQEDRIRDFINENVCDRDLPLVEYEGEETWKFMLALSQAPHRRLDFLRDWKVSERELFFRWQHCVNVPFLDFAPDRKSIKHVDFPSGTIMPWSSVAVVGEGGFSTILKVHIHPDCHEFQKLPSIITGDCFAVKRLSKLDGARAEKQDLAFRNERNMMKRFNGFIHPHLITLLMTWTLEGQQYFLFPYAECDLEVYWSEPSNWAIIDHEKECLEIESVRWISKQILGLTDALDSLHNPRNTEEDQERRFGRHGDIKPENILWFRCPSDKKGILVLTDFGLSSYDAERSRSNKRASEAAVTPSYRPPEFDMQNGKISRSSDVWQLGCVFLEFVCWALGGPRLREKFGDQRTSPYITGVKSDAFFEVELSNDGQYVFRVKESVSQFLEKLHEHPLCTSYFHHLLDIISVEMLVVQSHQKRRSTSTKLLHRITELHQDLDTDNMAGKKPRDPRVEGPKPTPFVKGVLNEAIAARAVFSAKPVATKPSPANQIEQSDVDIPAQAGPQFTGRTLPLAAQRGNKPHNKTEHEVLSSRSRPVEEILRTTAESLWRRTVDHATRSGWTAIV